MGIAPMPHLLDEATPTEGGCLEIQHRGYNRIVHQGRYNYPQVTFRRKRHLVGRLVLEVYVSPCPEGLRMLHSCNNPACIAPSHLRWGTAKENTQDMIRAGRAWFQQRRVRDDAALGKLL